MDLDRAERRRKPPPTDEARQRLDEAQQRKKSSQAKEAEVKRDLASMATTNTVDDGTLKNGIISMLLIRLSKAKDTAEVVKISQELCKLRGLYAGRGSQESSDDEFAKRLVLKKSQEGKDHVA